MIIGLIGGSGLGQALTSELTGESVACDTPFGSPSAPLLKGRWHDVDIVFVPRHGENHTIPPSAVPYRANIHAMKQLGATHIIASGATGSLREEIEPRDIVIPDQVIDRTTQRISTFFNRPGVAAHIKFHEPFCPSVRSLLLEAGKAVKGRPIVDGATYVCMDGPAFSTVAESRMNRSIGGDLIGMTCMPEAKLAREAEICYGLIALPTDYDCWRPHAPGVDQRELLKEIIGNLHAATERSIELIKAALDRAAEALDGPCACRKALDLAVWTPATAISESSRERLGVILERRMRDETK